MINSLFSIRLAVYNIDRQANIVKLNENGYYLHSVDCHLYNVFGMSKKSKKSDNTALIIILLIIVVIIIAVILGRAFEFYG